MASLPGRLWARVRGPFERRFGEKWVEPGNAITRAIAAGLAPEKLYMPVEPARTANAPTMEPAVAAAIPDVAVAVTDPVVPEERKVRRGRPRRAA